MYVLSIVDVSKNQSFVHFNKDVDKCDRQCINGPFTAKCKFSEWAEIAYKTTQFVDFAFM